MADWLQFIQQVKNNNDIVSVIGSYIDLSPRGQNFWARCPFHGENAPSFSVSRKGFYKCFGCGESGDVINFVQKFESCTFYEAVEILAKRANMTMPETSNSAKDQQLVQKKKDRDTYRTILTETARFYYRCYHSNVGAKARQYMTNRGFELATVKKFGIGYSPDMYTLVDHLQKLGYTTDQCVKAGVLSKSSNGKHYDAMCGRLIVPIIDISGKVIAFGGRALDDKTSQYGKYKNTTETSVFVKTNNLYAINIAKQSKQEANLPYIIMVEGYMDVIAMYQAGFPQCVASMGTSLTIGQAKLISRLVSKVYICYDGDSAGQKATLRGLDILATEGLEVYVMSIPQSLDPDEYISKYGKEAFSQLIDNALPLIDYKLSIFASQYDISNSNMSVRNDAIVKYVTASIDMLANQSDIVQQQYLPIVASKSGYTVEYLKRKMTTQSAPVTYKLETTLTAEQSALFYILSCVLCNSGYQLPDFEITTTDQSLDKILHYIYQCRNDNTAPHIDMIYTLCPDEEKWFYNLLTECIGIEVTQKDTLYYEECVQLVAISQLKQRRQQLMDKLKNTNNEDSQYDSILQQIQAVNQQIDKYNK